MTTEDKLKHFEAMCSENARERSAKMLEEYKNSLEEILENHKVEARRQAKMQLQAESEKLERDINKQLSLEQINMKRTINERQEELKSRLFSELRNKLALYMETSEYEKFLDRKISYALTFAGQEEITIYLDPSDQDKLHMLEMRHKCALKISQYSFTGGIRAVIPAKNILIDNSFQTMLAEAQDIFQFDLGGIRRD